jgi:outer membrane protein assembly factor BamB
VTESDPDILALSDASHDELWDRIRQALDVAINYGQTDGDHHKAWVIDQMVRHLTGCPTVIGHGISSGDGTPYIYDTLGKSEDYLEFVRVYSYDEAEGEEIWEWDEGIAP